MIWIKFDKKVRSLSETLAGATISSFLHRSNAELFPFQFNRFSFIVWAINEAQLEFMLESAGFNLNFYNFILNDQISEKEEQIFV